MDLNSMEGIELLFLTASNQPSRALELQSQLDIISSNMAQYSPLLIQLIMNSECHSQARQVAALFFGNHAHNLSDLSTVLYQLAPALSVSCEKTRTAVCTLFMKLADNSPHLIKPIINILEEDIFVITDEIYNMSPLTSMPESNLEYCLSASLVNFSLYIRVFCDMLLTKTHFDQSEFFDQSIITEGLYNFMSRKGNFIVNTLLEYDFTYLQYPHFMNFDSSISVLKLCSKYIDLPFKQYLSDHSLTKTLPVTMMAIEACISLMIDIANKVSFQFSDEILRSGLSFIGNTDYLAIRMIGLQNQWNSRPECTNLDEICLTYITKCQVPGIYYRTLPIYSNCSDPYHSINNNIILRGNSLTGQYGTFFIRSVYEAMSDPDKFQPCALQNLNLILPKLLSIVFDEYESDESLYLYYLYFPYILPSNTSGYENHISAIMHPSSTGDQEEAKIMHELACKHTGLKLNNLPPNFIPELYENIDGTISFSIIAKNQIGDSQMDPRTIPKLSDTQFTTLCNHYSTIPNMCMVNTTASGQYFRDLAGTWQVSQACNYHIIDPHFIHSEAQEYPKILTSKDESVSPLLGELLRKSNHKKIQDEVRCKAKEILFTSASLQTIQSTDINELSNNAWLGGLRILRAIEFAINDGFYKAYIEKIVEQLLNLTTSPIPVVRMKAAELISKYYDIPDIHQFLSYYIDYLVFLFHDPYCAEYLTSRISWKKPHAIRQPEKLIENIKCHIITGGIYVIQSMSKMVTELWLYKPNVLLRHRNITDKSLEIDLFSIPDKCSTALLFETNSTQIEHGMLEDIDNICQYSNLSGHKSMTNLTMSQQIIEALRFFYEDSSQDQPINSLHLAQEIASTMISSMKCRKKLIHRFQDIYPFEFIVNFDLLGIVQYISELAFSADDTSTAICDLLLTLSCKVISILDEQDQVGQRILETLIDIAELKESTYPPEIYNKNHILQQFTNIKTGNNVLLHEFLLHFYSSGTHGWIMTAKALYLTAMIDPNLFVIYMQNLSSDEKQTIFGDLAEPILTLASTIISKYQTFSIYPELINLLLQSPIATDGYSLVTTRLALVAAKYQLHTNIITPHQGLSVVCSNHEVISYAIIEKLYPQHKNEWMSCLISEPRLQMAYHLIDEYLAS